MSIVLQLLGKEALAYIEAHPEVLQQLLDEAAKALIAAVKKHNAVAA